MEDNFFFRVILLVKDIFSFIKGLSASILDLGRLLIPITPFKLGWITRHIFSIKNVFYYSILMFNIVYIQWRGGHCNKGDEKVCCKATTGYLDLTSMLIASLQTTTMVQADILHWPPFIEANVRPCLLSFSLTTFTYYYLI